MRGVLHRLRQPRLGRLEFFGAWVVLCAVQAVFVLFFPPLGALTLLPGAAIFAWLFAKRLRDVGLPAILALTPIEFARAFGPMILGIFSFVGVVALFPSTESDEQATARA